MAKGKTRTPKGNILNQFGRQIGGVVLILLILISFYSFFTETGTPSEEISLSALAQAIEFGEVQSIEVAGDALIIKLTDNTERLAKKEVESSLSQSLANYGVSSDKLRGVIVTIKNPSGVGFWLVNILPFLLPVVFIVLS